MQLIQQAHIDRVKWDALVMNSENATIYNQSVFLDALAENWCLLINDDYSAGLPIPFTIRLGVKGIYTPNFMREFSFLGIENLSSLDMKKVQSLLKKEFALCSLNLSDNYFNVEMNTRVFQQLNDEMSLNSQAKRSIKKFEKSHLVFEKCHKNDVQKIISKELTIKVKSLKDADMLRFETLLSQLNENELVVFGVRNETKFLGGQIFIQWKNKLHYIKGGCQEEAKNEGAMFMIMKSAINFTNKHELIVDFGGSNVVGVQQFNFSFGAKNVSYYEWKWDRSPFWYKILKKLKNRHE